MTVSQQIAALLKDRGDKLKALETLAGSFVSKDAAGVESFRLPTADEQKAFDDGKAAIAAIDAQLENLKAMEAMIASQAAPAPAPGNPGAPAPTPGVDARPFKAFPAQAFTRLVGAMAMAKGNVMMAANLASKWKDQTPEVPAILNMMAGGGFTSSEVFTKAAIAAGTTVGTNWALPLVQYENLVSEFIELLRPVTVFDQLTGRMTRIPFNVRVPLQSAGATANWVGEGLSKPVSALAFDAVTFPFAKIAVIVVITQELARFSAPSAELRVRDDLRDAVAQFIDSQFLTSTVAPSAALRPGAITNGVTPIASTGDDVGTVTTDLQGAIQAMAAANIPMRNVVWLMHPTALSFLRYLRTAQDVFAFNEEMGSGTLMGFPFIVSNNVPAGELILVDLAEIFFADDGDVAIDASDQASLQMDSAPATPPTPLLSLWQQNMLGIKAERFVYWQRRRLAAVQRISGFPNVA